MTLEERTDAFVKLGNYLQTMHEEAFSLNRDRGEAALAFENVCHQARIHNQWFTEENSMNAVSAWASALSEENIEQWIEEYSSRIFEEKIPKRVGVINAGNIPLVGFHDMLSVLMSGNIYIGKNASDDRLLLPYLAGKLTEIAPTLGERIFFEDRLKEMDAVIATGSNNSSRYFEYYFGKYPHIIRKNRNGVAVLAGDETKEDFENLGKDIFQYFGLGCRNVSKLFVPVDYDFKNFFEAIQSFFPINRHNKYMNNFEYNNAIYLLKQIPFLTNNFVILKEDKAIASPISVVHYEYYKNLKDVEEKLEAQKENIQCIVGQSSVSFGEGVGVRIPFGEAQHPQLWDYADGVDTMDFLLSL